MAKQMNYRRLDCPAICDICQKRRNQGNHDKCSKIRQARYEAD